MRPVWPASGSPKSPVTVLSLSQDESLLAAVSSGRLYIFRSKDLHKGLCESVWEIGTEVDIVHMSWDPKDSGMLALLGTSGELLLADVQQGSLKKVADDLEITCFAWSPLGCSLAVGVDDCLKIYSTSSESFSESIKMACTDAQETAGISLRVDGIFWMKENSICVTCEEINNGDSVILLLCVSWD